MPYADFCSALRLPGDSLSRTVPATHHQLSLIIRIDQPDQIPEHDTVLMTESRTRQDQCGHARIADVNGDPRRDQLGLAGDGQPEASMASARPVPFTRTTAASRRSGRAMVFVRTVVSYCL